jgi:hypothetical protein
MRYGSDRGPRRPAAGSRREDLGMDPRPTGFERLVLSCRAGGGVDVLDLPRGMMTPERLRYMSPRCSECCSRDIDLKVESVG